MGVKSGRFVSKNGHTYEVRISGNNVADADLTLGVPPVIISMAAGDHKFVGFKSTTATINIITDTPLLDLYAERVDDILVEVSDVTGGAMQFKGYVVPYSFEQPMTGCTDSVTVNAVDSLTVRKEMKYQNIGDVHGVDLLALDIVQGIALRGGLTRIVQHINFNWEIDQGLNPLAVMVAQAGFLQDEVSDCDALSAIFQFFGYTACAIGDTLYLYDEHCMLHAGDTCRELCGEFFYDVSRGAWIESGRLVVDNPLSLQRVEMGDVRAGISLSVERAYDGVQITPEGSEVSVLLPDVCDADNLTDNTGTLGSEERSRTDTDGDDYRTPLQSKVMELGKNMPKDYVIEGEITDAWDMGNDPVLSDSWTNGSMVLRLRSYKKKTLEVEGIASAVRLAAEEKNVLWVRGEMATLAYDNPQYVLVGRQREDRCYSHTGGRAAIRLSFVETSKGKYDISSPVTAKPDAGAIGILDFLCLRAGKKVFTSDYYHGNSANRWENFDPEGYREYSRFTLDGYTLLPTGLGSRIGSATAVVEVPDGERLVVELGWLNMHGACSYSGSTGNVWITSLEVVGDGDDINTACDALRHSFSNREGGEYLTVGTLLTTRHADSKDGAGNGVNARPGVVAGNSWCGSYMGRVSADQAIPLAGILMEQLKARYGQPHAAFKMTAEGNIKPFAAVEWNGKTYTVEAYDRDIYDDTTTITID